MDFSKFPNPSKEITIEVLEELGFYGREEVWGTRKFQLSDCYSYERGFSIEHTKWGTENTDRFRYKGIYVDEEIHNVQDIYQCMIVDYLQRGANQQLAEIKKFVTMLFGDIKIEK